MKRATDRISPAETITAKIIERLESGTRPWVQPWTGASVSRPLRACGTPYRGINVLWLWMAAEAAGYSSPFWMTYRQALSLGGQVRKGEHGTICVFYTAYRPKTIAEDEAADRETRRGLKSYTVFNACQVDGLPERFFPAPQPLPAPTELDQALDSFFAAIPARVRHWGAEAYYSPVLDQVTIPEPGVFRDMDHYRATLAHELRTGPGTRAVWHGSWAAVSAARPMRWRRWWPSSPPPSSVRSWACRWTISTIMPAIWPPGSRC
jgi:antirestriction protein ArdC